MTTYRSRASADAEAAHATLAAHVPDRETGICPVCRTAGPCLPANAAANRLVELDLPVLSPAPAAPPLTFAPLLTFGWRRRLGLPHAGGGR